MDQNRYAPPLAATADVAPEAAPTFLDKASKPMAGWLLQLLCAAGAVGVLYQLATMLGQAAVTGHTVVWWSLLFRAIILGGFLAWFGFIIVGVERRTAYGRWLGLGLLGMLMLAFVVFTVNKVMASEGAGATAAYHTGEIFGGVFWLLVLGAWINRFALARKARVWFRLEAKAMNPWQP